MSYELDKLKNEIQQLQWQKANNYEVDNLKHQINQLKSEITFLTNQIHYLSESVQGLKDRE